MLINTHMNNKKPVTGKSINLYLPFAIIDKLRRLKAHTGISHSVRATRAIEQMRKP
jgi:hypothetical protein